MKKIISLFSSLILLLLCAYTLHDMQVSQGVGYFFCLKIGLNRIVADILTDVVFILLFVLIICIPVNCFKVKQPGAFVRFLVLFVSLMPVLRTDYLFTLFSGNLSLCDNISVQIDSVIQAYKIIIILLILMAGYYEAIKGNSFKFIHRVSLLLVLLLTIPGLLFPVLTPGLLFIGCYILVIELFDFMEKTNFNYLGFYGFLFVTAIYRLVTVTAAW